MDYNKALKYFNNGKVKDCADYFKTNGHNLEYAYSLLMSGKMNYAEKILSTIPSVRADWAFKLIKILKNSDKYFPSYFQIRNFLEIDINLLFKSEQNGYVDKLTDNAEVFQNINQESYKFFGRVLLKNDRFDVSKFFLDKALDICYNDPELHFLRVELYYNLHDIANAQRSIETCLAVSPDYYPAQKIIKNGFPPHPA